MHKPSIVDSQDTYIYIYICIYIYIYMYIYMERERERERGYQDYSMIIRFIMANTPCMVYKPIYNLFL